MDRQKRSDDLDKLGPEYAEWLGERIVNRADVGSVGTESMV